MVNQKVLKSIPEMCQTKRNKKNVEWEILKLLKPITQNKIKQSRDCFKVNKKKSLSDSFISI